MTAPKQKRLVVRVVPHKYSAGLRWLVTLERAEAWVLESALQSLAIDGARCLCRELHEHWGFLVELHVHSRKGRVRIRETYGADPRRTKG